MSADKATSAINLQSSRLPNRTDPEAKRCMSSIFEIIALAAFTGARRNEILALRWCDLDPVARTLQIERSLEESRGAVQKFKGPKRDSHKRTILIDDALVR